MSLFQMYKISEKSKVDFRFWKKSFWVSKNLDNLWNLIFSLNPYTFTILGILFVALTTYMLINNSDGYELIPAAKWFGFLWIIPTSLSYMVSWTKQIINKTY